MEQSNVRKSGHDLKSAKKTRAFALIEVMITAGILIIISTALLATFVYCIVMNESNKNKVIAANDAQYVLEQITYNSADYKLPTLVLDNETIPAPTITTTGNLKEVTVSVSWSERQANRSWSLSTKVAR